MSHRNRDPSVWACTLLFLLHTLLLNSSAIIPVTSVSANSLQQQQAERTHCDNACRERRVLSRRRTTTTTREEEAEQPLYIDYLDYLDDEEDPESNLKMWRAIAESLRQWQERKLRAAANQSEPQTTNLQSSSSSDSPPNSSSKKSRRRRDEESVCYGRKEFCFKDKGPFDYLDTLPGK